MARPRPLLALVMGALLAGLAAEAAARWAAPAPPNALVHAVMPSVTAPFSRADPRWGRAATPGTRAEVRVPGLAFSLRTNHNGLRGPQPVHARRTLVTGDSFVFAGQTPEDQVFVALLEERLEGHVLNAGLDGAGTWQAVGRLSQLGPTIGADAVVHVLYLGNDPLDDAAFAAWRRRGGPWTPRGSWRPPPAAWAAGARHSAAAAWALVAARAWQLAAAEPADQQRFVAELRLLAPDAPAPLTETRAALAALRAEADRQGARLWVAVAPPAAALDPEPARRAAARLGVPGAEELSVDPLREAVLVELAALEIAACDLTPALRAAHARGEEPYLPFDGHWSPAGHAAVAGALAACLEPR